MRAAKGMVLRGTAAGRGPSGDATHLEGECGRPGQLGRKPTPGRRPCRLRAGSGRSCTRAELGRATSCLSPIAGLLGLPRRSQQKHWTGQEPAPRRQGRRAAARLRPPSLLLQKSANPAGSVSASLGPSALIGERLAQARSPSVGGDILIAARNLLFYWQRRRIPTLKKFCIMDNITLFVPIVQKGICKYKLLIHVTFDVINNFFFQSDKEKDVTSTENQARNHWTQISTCSIKLHRSRYNLNYMQFI
ncbi:uncharacterized protein LOC118650074 [Myotis myotis]|uniref:uncharacterized protein LOC118650074 n=1 Tax=Myotis myotis TaxID=51298 RepID=UPI00174D0EC3|nr:uncharacterized protein LOC118650074 [Myotis myotis]